ncbi:MAG: hypothetical protein AAF570_07535 [Bacteroidota bacterium]
MPIHRTSHRLTRIPSSAIWNAETEEWEFGWEMEGKKQGIWSFLAETGVLKREVRFVEGKKHGKVLYFREDGVVFMVEDWEMGEKVEEIEFRKRPDFKRVGNSKPPAWTPYAEEPKQEAAELDSYIDVDLEFGEIMLDIPPNWAEDSLRAAARKVAEAVGGNEVELRLRGHRDDLAVVMMELLTREVPGVHGLTLWETGPGLWPSWRLEYAISLEQARRLPQAFPDLQGLNLNGQRLFPGVFHPKLEYLHVERMAIDPYLFAKGHFQLPLLENFAWDTKDDIVEGQVFFEPHVQLPHPADVPLLTALSFARLDLHGWISDAFVDSLTRSALFPHLRDLGLPTLGREGATDLLAAPSAFAHLNTLSIGTFYGTRADWASVDAAFGDRIFVSEFYWNKG